jgi:hypothetical protein
MSGDSTETQPVHPGPPPGLLRLVKVLGVVMVLLFLALIAGIIWKATRKPAPPAAVDVVVDLGIDPASIRHMSLEGGNLAVSTEKELMVIDLKSRKVTLRAFKPAN